MTLTELQKSKIGEWIGNNAFTNPAQAAAKTAKYILTHLNEFLPDDDAYNEIQAAARGEETDDDQMLYARAALNSPYRAMYEAMKQEKSSIIFLVLPYLMEIQEDIRQTIKEYHVTKGEWGRRTDSEQYFNQRLENITMLIQILNPDADKTAE